MTTIGAFETFERPAGIDVNRQFERRNSRMHAKRNGV